MEYAARVVGTKLILVLGHTKCGAIIGACDHVPMGNQPQSLEKIRPAILSETATTENRNSKNKDFLQVSMN
jgi:carbonic anhydrase